MRINRSLPTTTTVVWTGVVIFTVVFSSCDALPAQQRPLGFVDRLARANPFRTLANYISRKLTMDLYYPPAPSQHQLLMLQPQPQALFYAKPLPSHYTKLPALPPVFYTPTVTMIPPPQPHSPQPQNVNAQAPPKYMLHGVSYKIPHTPAQQQFQNSQPPQAPSYYYQPTVFNSNNNIQQQSLRPQMSVAPGVIPQTGILTEEHHQIQNVQQHQQQQQQQQPFITNNQVESSHHHYQYSSAPGDSSLVTLPTITSSANKINEGSSSSASLISSLPNLPQLSENVQMQIDGYEDPSASSAQDMLKIFVIRPKDLEKMRHSSEQERAELVKGYSMKYIDVEQGAQELVLPSSQQQDGAGNEVDDPLQQNSCIEPLCDSFLQKLIPEIFSSASFYPNGNGQEDPIVIVKNNSETYFHGGVNPFLKNHRLEERSNENEARSQFTVMRSVEEEDGGNAVEILQGQDSTLKPQRIKVHFPRRKFLSSKLNSTRLTKYEPKSYKNVQENRSPSQDSLLSLSNEGADPAKYSHSLVPKPRNFDREQKSYPDYRYGSKQMAGQRIIRGDGGDGKSSKMMHYTAGVLFNNDSKV